nr:MAG TPA: hypothetical protein [Microviridae sp.]
MNFFYKLYSGIFPIQKHYKRLITFIKIRLVYLPYQEAVNILDFVFFRCIVFFETNVYIFSQNIVRARETRARTF